MGPRRAKARSRSTRSPSFWASRRCSTVHPANLSAASASGSRSAGPLMSQPKLLLMDEPLSALDRNTKNEILPFLERLRDRLSPADRLHHPRHHRGRTARGPSRADAEGPSRRVGTTRDLQSDPSLPLGRARDAAVGLVGVVDAYDKTYGLLTVGVRGGRFIIPRAGRAGRRAPGAFVSSPATSASRASRRGRAPSSTCCRRASSPTP